MWLATLVVRLQFHAAPESGGRQPQHPSRGKQPLSLCPDPSQCTGSGHEETFSEHFAVEVRRSRWGYLKEFRFSGRCQSAGSSRKSWSVPGSPPFLLKQRGEAKKKPSRSRENRTTTKKAPGPETQRRQPPGPRRFFHFWATRTSEDFSETRSVHAFGFMNRGVRASGFSGVLILENSCLAPHPEL